MSVAVLMSGDSARGLSNGVREVWPWDKRSRDGNDVERLGVTEHPGTLWSPWNEGRHS